MAIDMRAAVKITAGVTGQQAVDQLRTGLDRVGNTANGLVGKFNLVKGAVGALAAAMAVREVVSFGKSLIDAADNLQKMSARTGVAVEELSKLQQVASLSGTNLESVTKGFGFLAKQMLEAASGGKAAQEAFKSMGVEFKNADGTLRNTNDVFADLSDKFAAMPDGAAKVAFGQKLIGKGFVDLIPMINEGGDAIRNVAATISTEFADRAALFNDTIEIMQTKTVGLVNVGLNELLKSLQQILDVYSKMNSDGSTVSAVFNGIGVAVKGLVIVIDTLITGVRQAIATLQYFGETLFKLVSLDFKGAKDAANARLNEIVTLGQEYKTRMDALLKPPPSALPAATKRVRGFMPEIIDTESAKKQTDAAKKLADEVKRLFEETRTPAENLNSQVARLNELLSMGAIDWDLYSRAVFEAQEKFDQAMKKSKDTTKSLLEDIRRAAEGIGKQMTDAIVDFAMTGKLAVGDMVDSIIRDMARLLIQRQVTGPLMSAFEGIIGSAFGAGFGTQAPAPISDATFIPVGFANGGVMTSMGELPLNAYSKGGIANSPQMAVFGEGRTPEAYVPLPDGRTIPVSIKGGAAAGEVTVNVYNQPGQSAQVQQRQTGSGTEVDVIIEQVESGMARNIQRGGGIAPVLERQYGLNRAAGAFR
jgi:ribosomal protein L12E/L44/L45/RPP1/RPP2